METIDFKENLFYIDDITRRLSEQYDVGSYQSPCRAISDAFDVRQIVGRLLFISKMVGQIVGVTLEQYLTEWPDEGPNDKPPIYWNSEEWEKDGKDYAKRVVEREKRRLERGIIRASHKIKPEAVRIIQSDQKIYVPSEALVLKVLSFASGKKSA